MSKKLNTLGISTILNLVGENTTSKKEINQTVSEYKKLANRVWENHLDASISIKPTQLGLNLDTKICLENIRKIAKEAKTKDIFVWIDTESLNHYKDTLNIYFLLAKQFKNIGIAMQACVKRSTEDANKILSQGGRIRLCKGAYSTANSGFVFETREQINQNFLDILNLIFQHESKSAIATNDLNLIDFALKASENRVHKITFQTLMGTGDELEKNLLWKGQRIERYTPYGDKWLDYCCRRDKWFSKTQTKLEGLKCFQ